MAAAEGISKAGVTMLRGGLWKPRTHPGCFEGVGETGARWLRDAGRATGMKTITEVANARHVEVYSSRIRWCRIPNSGWEP